MAQEVASAYVTLLPSARGFGRATEKEIGGPLRSTSDKGTSLLGGMFKKAVGFASAAAVAMGGYFSAKKIFGGGLDRLLNIEDAQAKLKGLGHDAGAVTQIMNDALASVRGTAYGMDAAATTAASAVAAGIKPGQELEKYLKLTADAATIAGISMDEMGGIINKVTTSGFAMTDNLNQLADRGIPIFQWLQDEYGVTAEELRKMVSQGEVDAETFRKVIEENIGGAALASGDTTRGAIANLGAALSRIGAGLLGGVFPLFREAIVGITDALGPMEDAAGRIGEAFGAWATGTLVPTLQTAGEALGVFWQALSGGSQVGELDGVLGTLNDIGANLYATFAPLAPVIGDALGRIFEAISPLLPAVLGLVTAFSPLGLVLKAIGPILPTLVEAFVGLAETLVGALAPVLSALLPVVSEVASVLVTALAGAFETLLPVIVGLLPVITSLVQVVGGVLLTVVQALSPLLLMVADIFASLMPVVMSLITPLMGIVQALLPIVNIVGELIGALLPPLVDLFMALLEPVLALIAPLVEALAPVLELIGTLIEGWMVPYLSAMALMLTDVLGAVIPVISALAGGLVSAISAVIRWVTNAVGAIARFVSDGVRRFGEFASKVGSSIGDVVAWVRDIPNKIGRIFANAGSWLKDAGRKIIQGLLDGITGAFDRVRNTLSDLTARLPDWKGPAQRDRRLLFNAGQLIMGGLVEGLESQYGSVERSLAGLTAQIGSTSLGVDVSAAGGVLPGGRVVHQTNNVYGLTAGEVERLTGARLSLAMVGS